VAHNLTDRVKALVLAVFKGLNDAVTPTGRPGADQLTLPVMPFVRRYVNRGCGAVSEEDIHGAWRHRQSVTGLEGGRDNELLPLPRTSKINARVIEMIGIEFHRVRTVMRPQSICLVVLSLVGCGGSGPQNVVTPPPTVDIVTVAPSSVTITAGQTQQFSATAKDVNGSVIPGVTFSWSSDATSVATVNTTGLAAGVSQGTAHITATVSGVTGSATLTVNTASSGNAIPSSFYGFTINKQCSIADTNASGLACNNPEPHSFPGLPLAWSRSLGADFIKWSDMVQCDPTGSVCPKPGSGCSKNGRGANGTPCPSDQLVANCQPSSMAPDDPANCAYVWQNFDFWTKTYNAHAVDWMYDAYYTPDYLSVRGSRCTGNGQADFGADPTCIGAADICHGTKGFMWGCDQPFDIDATPGSGLADGSDQHYKWFTTAFMKHLRQNAEHITYWEVWNEPNICAEWNHGDQAGVDCPNQNTGGGPSTGSVAQLVRMAQDARAIIPGYDLSVKITSPPVVGVGGINNYLSKILVQGGQQFDLIGFHGYYQTSSGCPTGCPVPESWVAQWEALASVSSNAGQAGKPAINTEFSWGAKSNLTDPDMRAAQAARIYLLQESYYPALVRVDWYGEDFPIDNTPNPKNNNLPSGGTGEFWASGSTNTADNCVSPDLAQGGFDCPAGLAVNQVSKWTIGASFVGPCTCSASPNGGSCSSSPPTGIWQCSVTRPNGYQGLFVWDNTATSFPCTNPSCGTTTFNIPSAYTADWQDLNGNVTPLAGATTVTIGAKPILIENARIRSDQFAQGR
jgi:hypothetical protein